MATSIYLGNPPENIKKWIEENYVIPTPSKYKDVTQFVYADGTIEEYNVTIVDNTLCKQAGLFDDYDDKTDKYFNHREIIFGTKVETIDLHMQYANKFYIPGNVKTLNLRIATSDISEIIFEEGLTVLNVSTYSNINTSGIFFPDVTFNKDIILPESLNEFNGNIINSGEYGTPFNNKLIFKGKTIEQVKQMAYYPFGIDESQIEVL